MARKQTTATVFVTMRGDQIISEHARRADAEEARRLERSDRVLPATECVCGALVPAGLRCSCMNY